MTTEGRKEVSEVSIYEARWHVTEGLRRYSRVDIRYYNRIMLEGVGIHEGIYSVTRGQGEACQYNKKQLTHRSRESSAQRT